MPFIPKRRSHRIAFCAIAALVVIGGVAGYSGFATFKNSAAFQSAIKIASSHPDALRVLGAPIEVDGFTTGHVSAGDNGAAKVAIPLRGANTNGMLHLAAHAELGQWSIDGLILAVAGERYDLLEDASSAASDHKAPSANN